MIGASAAKVFVEILPDAKGFSSAMQRELEPAVQSGAQRLSASMTKVGTAMTAGLTVPLVALGTKAFGAFEEASTVAAQTAAAIKSTGGAANITAQQVSDLATRISEYSGIDDEAIGSAENMLLTFTNVRNEVGKGNDVFNQATSAVADMATRMAKGAAPSADQLQSSSVLLGKALNDPIKGLSALSRVGVSFSEQQRAAIATMVESGNTMGAQKVILAELAKEFGGSAKAFGDSAAGGAAKAKVSMGNAMEAIGAAIAPVIEKVAAIAKAITDWFSALPAPAQKIIAVIGGIVAAVGPLLLLFAKLPALFEGIAAGFKVLTTVMSANPWAALIAGIILLVIIVVKNWDKIKAAILAAWNWIKHVTIAVWNAVLRFLKKFWPVLVGVMTGGLGLVVALIIKNWSKVKAFTVKVWQSVLAFLKSVPRIIVGIFASAVRWLVGAGAAVMHGLFEGLRNIWSTVSGWLHSLGGLIKNAFAAAGGWLLSAGRAVLQGLWNGLISMWSTVWGWLSGLGGMVARGVGNLGSVLWDAGAAIIRGLIGGITSMIGAAINAVKNAVGGIIRGAKNLLGIGSPSKVFAAIGADTMRGLSNGLADVFSSDVEPLLRRMAPMLSGKLQVGGRGTSFAELRAGGVAITGALTLTPDGRAFVEGIIARSDRDSAVFTRGITRMRGAS